MTDTKVAEASRTRWPLVGVGMALLILVGGLLVVRAYNSSRFHTCAGVGLSGYAAGSSPEAALDGFLSQVEQRNGTTIDRSKWHERDIGQGPNERSFGTDDPQAVARAGRGTDHAGPTTTFDTVTVASSPDGRWTVSGGCV